VPREPWPTVHSMKFASKTETNMRKFAQFPNNTGRKSDGFVNPQYYPDINVLSHWALKFASKTEKNMPKFR
jgi:hypothetical protein